MLCEKSWNRNEQCYQYPRSAWICLFKPILHKHFEDCLEVIVETTYL